jgi:hypothetical protein
MDWDIGRLELRPTVQSRWGRNLGSLRLCSLFDFCLCFTFAVVIYSSEITLNTTSQQNPRFSKHLCACTMSTTPTNLLLQSEVERRKDLLESIALLHLLRLALSTVLPVRPLLETQ